MIEFLTNPWVIIVVVLSVFIGNIAALKYTAKMKFNQMDKGRKNDLDRLNELDKERYGDDESNKHEQK
ncbi:DUF2897 family protein [Vibrio parahaemolyticus]|nr:DUF2897 family protein [Vibrio parahaemolyticus]EJC7052735.1 DUF2897 family protein [Vibrio parahaemolyticus]EJC7096880.1 DUF2897 family protein [Vibrio parahaemolyticus]EJC7109948.1 DUF2897 family protein [Vibrio parahaemolyticus]EJC7131209.1 DUF2897 family protein [Vibrio parahaemolyticus]